MGIVKPEPAPIELRELIPVCKALKWVMLLQRRISVVVVFIQVRPVQTVHWLIPEEYADVAVVPSDLLLELFLVALALVF